MGSEVIYGEWRERLIEALDPRYHNAAWLDDLVWSGRGRVFIGLRSCAIAETVDYPTGAKDVHVVCAAGDAFDARDMIVPQLVAWANDVGALSIRVTSRPAWIRILEPFDFYTYKVDLRKEL